MDGLQSFSCMCMPDFTGSLCEMQIDDCSTSPCLNGECSDGINSFSCSCFSGYSGDNCTELGKSILFVVLYLRFPVCFYFVSISTD